MYIKSMKRYILGINLPIKAKCHESGVALIDDDGNVVFAAAEERFSRKKLDGDFPELSIKKMLEFTGIKKEEVFYVVIPAINNFGKFFRFAEFIYRERLGYLLKPSAYKVFYKLFLSEKNVSKIKDQEGEGGFKMKFFWKTFIKQNFPNAKIVKVDHHMSHASGAYFTSPWEESLIITSDGAGNLLSSVVAVGKAGKIKNIDKTFVPHSAGVFWGSVTKVCGFKSGTRHGGKVTGLAASGDSSRLIDKFRQVIKCDGLRLKTKEELFFDNTKLIPDWGNYEPDRLKNFLGETTREDVAAGAQKRLEEVLVELTSNAINKTGLKKVVLSGGVFANVLLNQKIFQLPEVEDVYVFPAMSDGGLALGAALYFLSVLKIKEGRRLLPKNFGMVYFGPSYSKKEVEESLKTNKVLYKKMTDSAKEIAKLIYDNKIVAFYSGRMEYGPRALGNRSIIYAPIDPTANDWLNKKLNRSEFMPFAPATMAEHTKENYIGIQNDPLAAKYMTITYNCTDKMKKEAPACVHLDGTARPQVIKREDNPYYYDIINEYYKLSGIPTLINTSFNMHEEPIVASPEDAIRAFLDSGIDYLVMENYLCNIEDNKHLVK